MPEVAPQCVKPKPRQQELTNLPLRTNQYYELHFGSLFLGRYIYLTSN